MGGFGGGGRSSQWLLPPVSLCYSPERWRARQDFINDQAIWMGLYKVWQNGSFYPKFTVEKIERLSKERQRKKDFSNPLLLSSFFPFPRSLISWVAPLSSPPCLSARPEQSLGILEVPLCSCSWLTYLFNYFTVCLLFKWRGSCYFFSFCPLFQNTSFSCWVWAAGPNGCKQHLWSAMTLPSKGLVLDKTVCISKDKGCITHYCFKHLEVLPWEQAL